MSPAPASTGALPARRCMYSAASVRGSLPATGALPGAAAEGRAAYPARASATLSRFRPKKFAAFMQYFIFEIAAIVAQIHLPRYEPQILDRRNSASIKRDRRKGSNRVGQALVAIVVAAVLAGLRVSAVSQSGGRCKPK